MGKPLNVVLFTSGSAGDILPFLRVGAALAAREHRVTLVSHAGYGRLARDAGLAYRAFDTPEAYAEYLRHASLLNTPAGITRFLLEYSLPSAPAALACLLDTLDEDSLLITSPTFDTASRIAGELLGLRPLWLFIAPVQLSEWSRRRAVRAALYRGVLGEAIEAVRAPAGLAPIVDWDAWLRYSSRSCGPWPDWFAAPDEDWLPGVEPVGFFIDHPAERNRLPDAVAEFLRRQTRDAAAAPLLVTGGTGRYLGEAFYAHVLGAARQLNLPTIVVTRDQDCLPESLPANAIVVEHLPFGVVMPQCSAVVHHGGIGTLAAAAAAGVPQLILAYGADRPDNGARIARCGIGESIPLPQCSDAEVASALRRLTTDARLRDRCREASAKILGHDGARSAARLAEAFHADAGRPD